MKNQTENEANQQKTIIMTKTIIMKPKKKQTGSSIFMKEHYDTYMISQQQLIMHYLITQLFYSPGRPFYGKDFSRNCFLFQVNLVFHLKQYKAHFSVN